MSNPNQLGSGLNEVMQKEFDEALAQGNAALKAGNPGAAIEQFRQCVDLNPTSSRAYALLGAAYYQKQQWPGAVSSFLRASELDPSDAKLFYNLGMACEANGMIERAEQAYRKALEVNPSYSRAEESLYQLLTRKGQGAEADDGKPMLCVNHRTKEAVGKCVDCGLPVCEACSTELKQERRAWDEDDQEIQVRCNRCAYASGQVSDAMASRTGFSPIATGAGGAGMVVNTEEKMEAFRKQYEQHDFQTKTVERRSEQPPGMAPGLSQHQATLQRQAMLIAQQAKAQQQRKIIGALVAIFCLVAVPFLYFYSQGGFAPGVTKLCKYIPFVGRYTAKDKSFKFVVPYGWTQMDSSEGAGKDFKQALEMQFGQPDATVGIGGDTAMYKAPSGIGQPEIFIFAISSPTPDRVRGLDTEQLAGAIENADYSLRQSSNPLLQQLAKAVKISESRIVTNGLKKTWLFRQDVDLTPFKEMLSMMGQTMNLPLKYTSRNIVKADKDANMFYFICYIAADGADKKQMEMAQVALDSWWTKAD
jgi:hypothetical protein